MHFSVIPKQIKKTWRFLQRPDLLFYILLYFMGLLITGTIAQKSMGLFPATNMFFNSFIIWYGILPLPGGALVMGLLFINLLVHFLAKSTWSLHSFGNNLAHLSILILLLGGGITLFSKKEGFLLLPVGETTKNIYQTDDKDMLQIDSKPAFTLPFSVTLEQFDHKYHTGTDIAEYYLSEIRIKDRGQSWEEAIMMNDPVRHKGYTIYQSSFIDIPDKPTISVLSVVYNPGWLFPYIATGLLFFGLAFHAGMRRYEKS